MLNRSNRMDLNIGWAISHQHWVAQRRRMDRHHRKAHLSRRDQDIRSSPICPTVLGRSAALERPSQLRDGRWRQLPSHENGLAWDMFRQVGLWLRMAKPPIRSCSRQPQRSIERMYAWGYSQTGAFLYTYINATHPLTSDPRQVDFDAYLIGVASGPVPINQCSPPSRPAMIPVASSTTSASRSCA